MAAIKLAAVTGVAACGPLDTPCHKLLPGQCRTRDNNGSCELHSNFAVHSATPLRTMIINLGFITL